MKLKRKPADGYPGDVCSVSRCNAAPMLTDASGARWPFDVFLCEHHWEEICDADQHQTSVSELSKGERGSDHRSIQGKDSDLLAVHPVTRDDLCRASRPKAKAHWLKCSQCGATEDLSRAGDALLCGSCAQGGASPVAE
jgi:hypothetical protein